VIYSIKLISKIETFFLSQFLLKVEFYSFIIYVLSTSCVGPVVGGLVLEEGKAEQEVSGGPQATSFEELNLEQGKPQCI
jgi:hypothetical protein